MTASRKRLRRRVIPCLLRGGTLCGRQTRRLAAFLMLFVTRWERFITKGFPLRPGQRMLVR